MDHVNLAFEDHSNGAVTDLDTGLMWAKCSLGQSGDDCGTGEASTVTWQAALDQAEAATLSGFEDWRVPTIKELLSLVDYDAFEPAIDTQVFPQTGLGLYWSSSTTLNNPEFAWRVYFHYGYTGPENKTTENLVRFVRAGQTPLINGEPLAGLADAQDNFRLYTIAVPGDAS